MKIARFYHPGIIPVSETLTLSKDTARHITTVLRFKINDPIILFNGDGADYLATIVHTDKKYTQVFVAEKQIISRESPLALHLGQAISRGERMDTVIQKSVELGVTEITPLITTHCAIHHVQKTLDKKQAHWSGIMISACEQSGRTILPILHPPMLLPHWLSTLPHGLGIVCDPYATLKISSLKTTTAAKISVLIGPEGGLSKAEVTLATQNSFIPVQFGKRILRTETAALAVISILQHAFGDI